MRESYLDNARWITIVLVIIYHVIYMFNGAATAGVIGPFFENQWWDALQYILYPWFMVLLFVIAGMSSRFYLERHTDKDFFKSRTSKLLVPSTIGLLVFHWITGYFNMSIGGAFETMPEIPTLVLWLIEALSGTGVLWFIQMLWLYSLLLILIRKIEKNKLYEKCRKVPAWIIPLLLIPIWGSAQILNTPVIAVFRFGIYGLSFLIGYFLLSHDAIMNSLTKGWNIFLSLSVILACISVYCYFGDNYAIPPIRDSFLSISYAWAGTLAMLTCTKKWFDKQTIFTAFCMKKSWGLYVFHYTFIAAAAYLMKKYCSVPAILQYIICLFVAFAGSYILAEIVSRIPIIRYLLLGIRKEKSNAKE